MHRKVCFKHIPPSIQKFCLPRPPNSLFCPQNLATGQLYASLHFQTSGILTVLTSGSANVSDFSLHIIFAISWHGICDLTVAMIEKTLSNIRSLCLLQNKWNQWEHQLDVSYKLICMQSQKASKLHMIFMWFFFFDLNEMIKIKTLFKTFVCLCNIP